MLCMMMSMATMHKYMHQWAKQNDQIRQCLKQVLPVLHKKEVGDGSNHNQGGDATTRPPERLIALTHDFLLFYYRLANGCK